MNANEIGLNAGNIDFLNQAAKLGLDEFPSLSVTGTHWINSGSCPINECVQWTRINDRSTSDLSLPRLVSTPACIIFILYAPLRDWLHWKAHTNQATLGNEWRWELFNFSTIGYGGFSDKEENYSDFSCSLLFRYLEQLCNTFFLRKSKKMNWFSLTKRILPMKG